MRTLQSAAAILLASLAFSPVFAQDDAAPSAAPELAALRKDYQEQLGLLLQKYVVDYDVAAAADVSREIERAGFASTEGESGPLPVGRWKWIGYSQATIASNGVVTSGKNKGLWKWVDEAGRKFQVAWENGYIDQLTIAPNGKMLHGTNNQDAHFVAYLIPKEPK